MMSRAILFLFLTFISIQSFGSPAGVVIIRHGEKPDSGNELDSQGCERAFSLPGFFLKNNFFKKHSHPAAVYAVRPANSGGSVRSIQTIAPTADELKLPINDTYTKLDYSGIVNEIMTAKNLDGQTVIIAWEHDAIPGLAQAFGVTLDTSTESWPDPVFDEAWVIDFENGVNLSIVPEDALSTDNPLGGNQWQNGPTSNNAPVVSSSLANTCKNNKDLNSIAKQWTYPATPKLK